MGHTYHKSHRFCCCDVVIPLTTGVCTCQCRASYYTTLFRVIWQLCSPQTAHILTLPMQPSIDGSAHRESSLHAYRCVVHYISHHKHAHHSGRHFAQGCGRLNAHKSLVASRSQDQCMQCCCIFMLAIDTAEQLSLQTCGELPRQSPVQTVKHHLYGVYTCSELLL